MKQINRLCLICVFLCHAYLIKAEATDPFVLADSFANAMQWRLAALEYDFVGFYNSQSDIKSKAILRKAECLKQLGKYSEAQSSLDKIVFDNIPDSLAKKIRYEHILCAYLASDYAAVETQVIQIRSDDKKFIELYSAIPIYVLSLNEQGKWGQAKKELLDYFNLIGKEENKAAVEEIYSKGNIPKLKKIKTAKLLSYILPGTGHMYLGYWGEGLASASLNALAVSFLGYNVYVERYFTSLSMGMGLLQKFYFGGTYRVTYLTEKKNYQLKKKFNDDIKGKVISLIPTDAKK